MGRTRAWVLGACSVFVLGFLAIWFGGQQVTNPTTVPFRSVAERIYPGTWPPAARGVLWLLTGTAAATFDLVFAAAPDVSAKGRRGARATAVFTGGVFVAFAVGSFVGADWSVIH